MLIGKLKHNPLILTLALSACAKNPPSSVNTSVKADPSITESFSVQTLNSAATTNTAQNANGSDKSVLQVNKSQILIAKEALEKEFLLQANMISQHGGSAQGSGLKSRVVAFRKINDKLYMLETANGHTVSNDLPINLLLAEFPILSQTESHIAFDFNAGMNTLFTAGDWYPKDLAGAQYKASATFAAADVNISYIEKAEIVDSNNLLLIRQIAQLKQTSIFSGQQMTPIEVKYYLSPYQPDPTFKAFRSPENFDRMGFFEITPQLRSQGSDIVYATKFHQDKPIVFSVSENTPDAYKQAVKEGITYWNKAFGKEVIKAIDAPKGVVVPDVQHNIVQWLNWDTAGFAYADAQMDPRTGETLHAQVYFTSVFAFSSKKRARFLLKHVLSELEKTKTPTKAVSIKGLESEPLCHFEHLESLKAALTTALSPNVPEEKVQKISQDYIRLVVAHEVGHTLGLRHNFAGSLAANYSLKDRNNIFASYVSTGHAPIGLVASSSAMEYNDFMEASMIGDQMVKLPKALEYDTKAIQTLYMGKTYTDDEIPLFCTDSHAAPNLLFDDCERFDIGSSSIEYAKTEVQNDLSDLANTLFYIYVNKKAPMPTEISTPIKKVNLPDPAATANALLSTRIRALRLLSNKGTLLKVRRTFPVIGSFNIENVEKEERNYIEREFERHGGLEAVLFPIGDDFSDKVMTEFNNLIANFNKNLTTDLNAYEFTGEEVQVMRNNVSLYLRKLHKELLLQELAMLNLAPRGAESMVGKLYDHNINNKLVEVLEKRLRKYVFSASSEVTLVEVEVPNKAPPAAPTPVLTQVSHAAALQPTTLTSGGTASPPATATPAAPTPPPAVAAVATTTKRVTLKLPKFRYPIEVRLAATSLLNGSRSETPDWAIAERAKVKEDYTKFTKDILMDETYKMETIPRELRLWIMENNRVSSAL